MLKVLLHAEMQFRWRHASKMARAVWHAEVVLLMQPPRQLVSLHMHPPMHEL